MKRILIGLILFIVGALMLGAAFAVAAEPHRQDAMTVAWVEPSANGNGRQPVTVGSPDVSDGK